MKWGVRARGPVDSLPPLLYAMRMCVICIDFARGALKLNEARRALGEMRSTLDPKHVREVEQQLDKAERDPPSSSTP